MGNYCIYFICLKKYNSWIGLGGFVAEEWNVTLQMNVYNLLKYVLEGALHQLTITDVSVGGLTPKCVDY